MNGWAGASFSIKVKGNEPPPRLVWYRGTYDPTVLTVDQNYCAPDTILNSTNQPILVIPYTATAKLSRSLNPLERNALIYLVRFEVPALGQPLPKPSRPTTTQDHRDTSVATLKIVDNTGAPPKDLIVSATDAATG